MIISTLSGRPCERIRGGRRALATVTLAAGVAAGCAGDGPERPVAVADVTDLMLSVLEPAAETYWDGVGEILTEEGVHQFRPLAEEDWGSLRNAAFILAESGNLLMLDGRVRDRGDWMTQSRLMVDAGRVALEAVDRRDPDAVFDAGAEVYYACRDCHARYAAETLRPSDPFSPAPADSVAAAGDR
ncbi:hypothetical protein [Candidatus Palauibacter sp.]|uniref:hypothetical protein n=1 Tax=Candidatus Palauibacter sp. TaxID=3101350 RepID=UPI003B01B10D